MQYNKIFQINSIIGDFVYGTAPILTLAWIALTISSCVQSPASTKVVESEKDTHCNIIHRILKEEGMAGFETDKAQKIWSELVEHFNLKLNKKSPEIPERLPFIHQFLLNQSYHLQPYNSLLSSCLAFNLYDCDILSLLYLGLAENAGWPLNAFILPQHMLVGISLKDSIIYWETTSGEFQTLSHYQKKYKIDSLSIGKGGVMIPLDKEKIRGLAYYNIAKAFSDRELPQKAIPFIYKSLQLWDDFYLSFKLLGVCFRKNGQVEYSEMALRTSLHLFDEDASVWQELIKTLIASGCPTEAREVEQEMKQRF